MRLYSHYLCKPCIVLKELIKKRKIKEIEIIEVDKKIMEKERITDVPTLDIDGVRIVGFDNIRKILEI